MKDVRLSLPTVVAIVAVTAAGAFAAGRSMPGAAEPSTSIPTASPPAMGAPVGMGGMAAQGAGAGEEALPPGHPPVDPKAGAVAAPGPAPSGTEAESSLEWKAPSRWQSMPNTSSMRLATYKVPRAEGDADDGDLSIMQAGGTVDANVERWIGQFDAASQKSAKRTTRKVGPLDVTIVEVQGAYSGGMGMGKGSAPAGATALLGAIVATPGMPHFFKLTGPVKTVTAARAEFDALVGSFATRTPR